jgi:hypothetical protein
MSKLQGVVVFTAPRDWLRKSEGGGGRAQRRDSFVLFTDKTRLKLRPLFVSSCVSEGSAKK